MCLWPRESGIAADPRSEEHTSELQSQPNLVCRLLLEKKTRTRQAAGAALILRSALEKVRERYTARAWRAARRMRAGEVASCFDTHRTADRVLNLRDLC